MRISGIPYIQGRNAYSDSDGRKYGIAIHCTANTASARNEANYATRRTDGVSGHLYADAVEVIQSLDTRARAGHAGSTEGNDHAVAVEITGQVGWSRTKWLTTVAWERLAAALVQVVRHYGIAVRRATVAEMRANPRVRAFYDHNQMRLAWGGTTHTDPGPNFPWDRLISSINDAMTGEDDMATAREVWLTDDLIKAPATREDKSNTHWTAASMLSDTANHAREGAARAAQLGREVVALRAEVVALRAEVRDRPAAGQPEPLDYDRLAAALLRKIAAGPTP